MVLHIYKVDKKLDLVFIKLGQSLQIININLSILIIFKIANFQITIAPYLHILKTLYFGLFILRRQS